MLRGPLQHLLVRLHDLLPHLRLMLPHNLLKRGGILHRQALANQLRRVTIELEELEFINSSCLKAMVAWIYKVDTEGRPYKIHLRRDAKMHWQRTSLATLQRLAPDVVVIEER